MTNVSVSALTPTIVLPGDELGQVDDVRTDVAQRARPGELPLQPPDQRELRVGDPVLQVDGAYVADLAEPAGRDQVCRSSATAGTRR